MPTEYVIPIPFHQWHFVDILTRRLVVPFALKEVPFGGILSAAFVRHHLVSLSSWNWNQGLRYLRNQRKKNT